MLHQSYSAVLVLISVAVASLAGFAALDLSARVAGAESRRTRAPWIAASALAMGVGIWSMHFVAMLALRIDVPVAYDVPLLVLSLVIAISASAITFTGATTTRTSIRRLAFASLAMGPAIAGMHYTGMAAMRMPARIDYNLSLVSLSVAIAITASFGALLLARHFRRAVRHDAVLKVFAACVMGAAVYGMHYTGMIAARFYPAPTAPNDSSGLIATEGLAWAIAAGASVVIALTLVAGFAGRRIGAARAATEAILETSLDCIITIDQHGKVLEFNPAAERVFGYTRQQAVGQELAMLIIPEHLRGAHRDGLRRFRESREGPILGRRVELPARTADGSEIIVELAITQVPVGDPPVFTGFLRDITERKRVEEALRASEMRYRALVEAMATVVWTARADGWAEDMPEWHAVTGQGADESCGFGWLDTVHPDDRERARQIWLSSVEKRTPVDTDFRVRHRDGTYRWYNARAVPVLSGEGTVREWVGVCVDVEERRRAHEVNARLAAIVESSDDAIVSKSLDGIIMSWNPGAEAMYGYTAAEAVGQHISLIIPPERLAEEDEVLARLRRGEKVDHFETERRAKDGRRLNVSVAISPIKDADGRVIGASKVARDITERRIAEEALRRAKAEAEEARLVAEAANRAKSEFLAAMSHELRTPLNAIAGYAELMKEGICGSVSDKHLDYLNRIRQNQRVLLSLINDVLNFAKLEAGRLEIKSEPVPVTELLASLKSLVAPQLQAKGLTYVRGSLDREMFALGDYERVRQILINLLTNAIKFTSAGGRITVGAAACDNRVQIWVGDTGRGIPAEKLVSIFEPFVQVNRQKTSSEESQGIGLGLAISRELARAMGGELTVGSTEGEGSTFTLSLVQAPAPSLVAHQIVGVPQPIS